MRSGIAADARSTQDVSIGSPGTGRSTTCRHLSLSGGLRGSAEQSTAKTAARCGDRSESGSRSSGATSNDERVHVGTQARIGWPEGDGLTAASPRIVTPEHERSTSSRISADCTKPSEPVSPSPRSRRTADEVVQLRRRGDAVNSSDTRGRRPIAGATTTAEAWATYDGCGPRPDVLSTRIDVDAGLAEGTDPAETSVQEWSGCDGGASVQLWTIPSGRHSPALTPAFGDAVVRFLVDHPKR